MRIRTLLAIALIAISALHARAEEADAPVAHDEAGQATEADQKTLEKLMPSLAVAEITLRADSGEQPYGAGWGQRCANCGEYHGSRIGDLLEEERPFETPAFVLSDDTVIIPEPLLHPRFIQSINVRQGDDVVEAKIQKYFTQQRAVLLKLANKLPDARPLEFAADDAKELKKLVYAEGNGQWSATLSGFGTSVTQTPGGARINSVTKDTLVVTPEGKAVALVFSDKLPLDDSWKTSPAQWPARTADEQREHEKKLAERIGAGIVRVHLSFRSPKANPADRMRLGRGDEENETERHVLGVVIAPKKVLVLAYLKPEVTARLERITVYPEGGKGVSAKFAGTIHDYAALIAETEEPLPQVMSTSELAHEDAVGPALTAAEVRLQGENRTSYVSRTRLAGLGIGWRRNLYPEAPLGQHAKETFVVDDQGNLLALPVLIRPKPTAERSYRSDDPKLTFARQLAPILSDPSQHLDPNNIPLSEQDENRIAWLGVELQPLTAELARLNKVSQLTDDGENGALVTYVYPNSPAATAGVQVGAVLLRLQVPDQALPIEIKADQYLFAEREFPWQRYDQFPEAYFDQMPHPWPGIATELARTLTEIGFGRTVTLEFYQDGEVQAAPVQIAQSPVYYDTAAKQKHTPTGLTLKAMTFELRRYFQIENDKPGLIIAGIEQGSRASKAGLKPFEYITHVNGKPVQTPDDFVQAAEGQDELRLDVVRMNKSRVVKVKVDAAQPDAPATQPATQPADEPAE